MVSQPGWITRGEATFLYQASLKRHRLIPNVPTLPELATSEEGRVILHAAASTGEFGRSILTTPGVPEERLAALRTAFQEMLKDPDFIAACTKRNLMLDPASGPDMDAINQDTMNLPKPIVEALRTLLKG
jgi:tripartite-type tricarboxylate transporter receptor subunit TctC